MKPHITPTIISFFQQLEQNNKVAWMHEHKKQYLEAKQQFEDIVATLIEGIRQFDKSIGHITPKDCTFRINRDIRFSKNKQPYKTHLGAFITPNGKKWHGAGYYIHIEPTHQSFIAAGNHYFDPIVIENFRKKISTKPNEFIRIQDEIESTKTYGSLEGDKLKRVPRGFSKEDPNAELLKYKAYSYSRPLTKKTMKSSSFTDECTQSFKELSDFVKYMNALNKS